MELSEIFIRISFITVWRTLGLSVEVTSTLRGHKVIHTWPFQCLAAGCLLRTACRGARLKNEDRLHCELLSCARARARPAPPRARPVGPHLYTCILTGAGWPHASLQPFTINIFEGKFFCRVKAFLVDDQIDKRPIICFIYFTGNQKSISKLEK